MFPYSLLPLLLPGSPAPLTAVVKSMTRLTCTTLTLLGKDPNVPLLPAPSTAPCSPLLLPAPSTAPYSRSPHCGGKSV